MAARPQPPMARIMSLYLPELRSLAVHTDKWTSSSSSSLYPDRKVILYDDAESTEIGIHFIFLPCCSDEVFHINVSFSSSCDRGDMLAVRRNQFESLFTVAVNWTCHGAIYTFCAFFFFFCLCGMYLCECVYGLHVRVVFTPAPS